MSYILSLATNLFSVDKAAKRGMVATFSDRDCKFTKGGQTILTGAKINENLYVLKLNITKQSVGLVLLTEDKMDLHEVMGHPCQERINKLIDRCGSATRNMRRPVVENAVRTSPHVTHDDQWRRVAARTEDIG